MKSSSECGCNLKEPLIPDVQIPINFEEFYSEQELQGRHFILSNILFDFDRAEIKNSFIPELNKLLHYLENNNSVKIRIKGFTDNIGTEEYNNQLSNSRAKAIAQWLLDNGISEERVSYEGHGSSEPMVENISEINREVNRRVEIEVVKNSK